MRAQIDTAFHLFTQWCIAQTIQHGPFDFREMQPDMSFGEIALKLSQHHQRRGVELIDC
jgi:hypothetical protein